MHRGWLLFIGLTAFSPLVLGAEGDVGKLLDQRLNSDNADQAKEEQVALAKGKRLAVLTEGEQELKDIDQLKTAISNWENQIKNLMTSSEGKVIASDPVKVKQFILVYESKNMKLSQAEAMSQQLTGLLETVRNPPSALYTPSETLLSEIHKQGQMIEVEQKNYARLQTKLNLLLKTPSGQTVATSGPTLQQAMEAYLEEEAKLELSHMQAAENDAREIARKELEKKYVDLLPSVEEDTYLREVAKRKDVQAQFTPFLSKGYNQIGLGFCHDPYRWHAIPKSAPVSLNGLEKCASIANVQNFLRDATHLGNDRPKWATPGKKDEAAWESIEKKLELFKKLAPIWVEMGLLEK